MDRIMVQNHACLDQKWVIMDILLELVKESGVEPKRVSSSGGGEYHSACPKCGGHDRFFFQPNYKMKNCLGRYGCRQCEIKGDTIQFCRDILGLEWEQAVNRSHAQVPQTPIYRFEKPINKSIIPPPIKWQGKARCFVDWASKEINKRADVLEWLAQRGICKEAVRKHQIGYSHNAKSQYGEFRPHRTKFGLLLEEHSRTSIWIPKGIVIPTIEPSGAVIRIKVRRDDWQPNDKIPKYVAVSGSMQGMNLVGSRANPVMAVVESELDALTLHQEVSDFACVVSVGSNTKNPDNFTDYLAKTKPFLLICHDNYAGGATMFKKWKGLYPHAKSHPTEDGKDIGEAVQRGVNIRAWVLSGLSNDFEVRFRSEKGG